MEKRSWIICLMALAFFASSCNFLDKKPDNFLTDELVWTNRKQVEGALYNIYSNVNLGNSELLNMMGTSDDAYITITAASVKRLQGGSWSPVESMWGDSWGSCYQSIRSSFLFTENVYKCPETEVSSSLRNQYIAEAKFLRGWYYWMLLKQFGPFILLRSTQPLNEDFNTLPRAPFDTCVAYINQMMDEAAANLPLSWPSNFYGKPTKGACLAVKAEVAMLAASELWNGNPAYASFKNKNGQQLAPLTKDPAKWRVAAEACKAVIDLNTYQLFTNEEEGQQFDPYLSYRDLFITNWNRELIFTWNDWKYNWWEKNAGPLPGGFQLVGATQNLVDEYYMKNGRWITDPASGYVEDGFAQSNGDNSWSHRQGNWNMYANREPRFYATILYNGRPVLGAPSVDDKNRYSSPQNADGTGRAEFYQSGKSGAVVVGYPHTCYQPLKSVNPASNVNNYNSPYRPLILLRYAQVLLNYAEALNESDPSSPAIAESLDQVRKRVGIPPIGDVYPEALGNQDLMRTHILRERHLELCFEGSEDRWYTLRRRMMFMDAKYHKIYGLNSMEKDNGQGFAFIGLYKRTLLWTKTIEPKMALWPVPQAEMDRDTALVQNPGW